MKDNTVDIKIEKAIGALKIYETDNIFGLTKSDYKLHSIIQYYHAFFEQIFYSFVSDYVKNISKDLSEEKKQKLVKTYFRIFDDVDFAKKIKIMSDFGLTNKTLNKKLYEFNQIRVTISHAPSYLSKIDELKEKNKYLKTLQLTIAIVLLLAEEVKRIKAINPT